MVAPTGGVERPRALVAVLLLEGHALARGEVEQALLLHPRVVHGHVLGEVGNEDTALTHLTEERSSREQCGEVSKRRMDQLPAGTGGGSERTMFDCFGFVSLVNIVANWWMQLLLPAL